MDRDGDAWGEPYNLGPPINSDAPEYFPSVTTDGTIYFTREGEDRVSATWRSRLVDGAYRSLRCSVRRSTAAATGSTSLSRRTRAFAIVPNVGREDAIGGVDYYVVFRSDDDTWSEPINMGPAINQPEGREWSASLSPDGKYLFFMSSRAYGETEVPLTLEVDHRAPRAFEPARLGQLGYLVGECGSDRAAATLTGTSVRRTE